MVNRVSFKSFTEVLLVAFMILSVSLSGIDKDISTDDILKKYITALGGEKALSDIETRFVQGYVVKDLHWDDPPYDVIEFVAYAKAPNMVHFTYFEDSGDRILGFDGNEGWQNLHKHHHAHFQ